MQGTAPTSTPVPIKELAARLASVTQERDEYRKAYELAQLELERLRRGLFGRKAEKVDAAQVALAFAEFEKQLAALAAITANNDAGAGNDPRRRGARHGRNRTGASGSAASSAYAARKTQARQRLDNNPSDLELRRLVVGRKNWLFVGSDETAPVTCTFVSLIASCALHGLNSEQYLRDLFRVLPSWPRSRVLELAPKYWKNTRDRIDPAELAMVLGPLTVPLPLPTSQAEE